MSRELFMPVNADGEREVISLESPCTLVRRSKACKMTVFPVNGVIICITIASRYGTKLFIFFIVVNDDISQKTC